MRWNHKMRRLGKLIRHASDTIVEIRIVVKGGRCYDIQSTSISFIEGTDESEQSCRSFEATGHRHQR